MSSGQRVSGASAVALIVACSPLEVVEPVRRTWCAGMPGDRGPPIAPAGLLFRIGLRIVW
jgi:hypothetical protein